MVLKFQFHGQEQTIGEVKAVNYNTDINMFMPLPSQTLDFQRHMSWCFLWSVIFTANYWAQKTKLTITTHRKSLSTKNKTNNHHSPQITEHKKNKTNNHHSPQITDHKKHHDIWRWKSSVWLGRGINMFISVL
jgi:hypothetical protein